MNSTLAATGLLMGLAGGPHCVAMCGAACAGLGGSAQGANTRSMWVFQAGRFLGYTAMGAATAASMQAVGWLSLHAAALRPVWTLVHVAAGVLGLVLLWQARQPVWLEEGARRIWTRMSALARRVGGKSCNPRNSGLPPKAAMALGLCWSLLPCGLLYSALLVAGLSGGAVNGAAVMALFAAGSGLSLMAGPWLWLRLRAGSGASAVRLAGAALAGSSAWALWLALVHDAAPWCAAG